jgi:uncharacterized phage protein (TIGR02220 family)
MTNNDPVAYGGDLPDPPYAADLKPQGWRFHLDYERLEQSDTWALASEDIRPWLLMLWLTAWKQVPCGSLPADETVITRKIGMSQSEWIASRDILLRGWTKHSDGRLYHKVIAEQAIQLEAFRRSNAERQAEWRIRRTQEKQRDIEKARESVTDSNALLTRELQHQNHNHNHNHNLKTLTPKTFQPPTASVSGENPDNMQFDLKQSQTVHKCENWEKWKFGDGPPPGREAEYVLAFLNKVSNHRYRGTKANLSAIKARLAEYDVRTAMRVITNRQAAWGEDPKMSEFINPITLFRPQNFARYAEFARKDLESS